ncbi:hypothetical protein O181_063278 [Austropuccinia psidii MF-1]|uniref:RNase H type-1 domain-containing protein n=1 Tax=Austropuccinia psidii MF-1 TaxID=1389203 RepID=A0A9Q3EL34_9BASI|nr:hypothetical protein [Austropuccinia psidii MF-1]
MRHIANTIPVTNFESELVGLKLAIELIRRELYLRRERNLPTGKIHILSDNQGALRKVANLTIPSTGQHLYLQISSDLSSLAQLTMIHLAWCPGHRGIEGNKKADSKAKKAALNPSIQQQSIPPRKANIKQRTKRENKPTDFTSEEKKRLRVKSFPKKFNKALSTQEKAITLALNQLRSKHVTLN